MAEKSVSPRISVVMPVRDGEAYLAEAVGSVLSQTFADFEFLIVDDGSRDRTPEILRHFAERDPRIRLHRTGGQGIVAALNCGIASSGAEYLARMDADDIALPRRFAAQLERMASDRDLVVLGSAAVEIDAKGREAGLAAVETGDGAIRSLLATRNPILHPTAMIRRAPLVAAGGYRPALAHAEDYDLWLRLSGAGTLANLAEPLLRLRRHGRQTSRTRSLDQRAAAALARRLAFAPEHGAGIDPYGPPAEAHAAYLRQRRLSSRPVGSGEAADIAVMLRACARDGAMERGEAFAFARRLAAEGGFPASRLLALKLLLRR